jgi:hypothetical protein
MAKKFDLARGRKIRNTFFFYLFKSSTGTIGPSATRVLVSQGTFMNYYFMMAVITKV